MGVCPVAMSGCLGGTAYVATVRWAASAPVGGKEPYDIINFTIDNEGPQQGTPSCHVSVAYKGRAGYTAGVRWRDEHMVSAGGSVSGPPSHPLPASGSEDLEIFVPLGKIESSSVSCG